MGSRLLQQLTRSITQERTVRGCPPAGHPLRTAHVRDFLFHYHPVCGAICENERRACAASSAPARPSAGWLQLLAKKAMTVLLLYTHVYICAVHMCICMYI